MMLIRITLFLTVLVPASAQFTCSIAGSKNAADCTAMTDDGAAHCVWCSIGGAVQDFGFCVSEVQAEAMESHIPSLHCDRYSGGSDDAVTDDQTPASDDAAASDDAPVPIDDAVPSDDTAPATDDTTPATDDDKTPANDDDHAVPDDYWTCLLQKDRTACAAAKCTWCDTQGGFGLCMTGPTAESASHSAWFTCHNTTSSAVEIAAVPAQVHDASCLESASGDACRSTHDATGAACEWCTLLDLTTLCLSTEQSQMGRSLGISCDETILRDDPYDPSCALAYVLDPSQDACVAAVDEDNAPCQFCTLSGFDLCLTAEQAQMGQPLGIDCSTTAAVPQAPEDPYDPTCAIAFLQDPTKEGCVAAVDADNAPCEFCSLPGVADLCLTAEQAAMGQQLGITCDAAVTKPKPVQDDPYDPSCLLAYLQDASKDACLAAVDQDHLPCEFCSLQGSLDLCLTVEQAQMGEQLGITCDEQTALLQADDDPYDPSCVLAYWEDASKDACVAAVDQDGNPCAFCSIQGVTDLCLTAEQVAMGQQLGITCDAPQVHSLEVSPFDPSCMAAYWTDQSEQECRATTDKSGDHCHYCALPGSFVACLTTEQAEVGKQLGMDCGSETAQVALPDDFFTCLQHYEEGDCRDSSCTWCNTEVGLGFCLAPAAAESTKQCTFFDCQFDDVQKDEVVTDIYDPVCLAAGMSATADDASEVCGATNGTDGTLCVWCDAAGVFGLCLSSEQAAAAGTYLQCNAAATA